MTTPTFSWDSSVNKSIIAYYNSVTGLPVFMDEVTGLPVDVIDRDARVLGRVKISDGTNVLDVLIQDAAFGTASKGLGVFGKYQVTPTAYTDGDAAPILLDANGRVVLSADIQIGAVELKDADTDGRANIKAANTTRTTGTLVIATQPIDDAGAVLSTSAIKTAVEVIDNFISGSRGLVTEDNSASIKNAVETIDNFISGSRGLVTEDNSAAIKTAVESKAAATTVTLYNVEMTLADIEYSQALPANTKILEFREQSTGFVTRYAFAAGKVAAPTAPYRTLDVGEVKTLDGLNLAAATLYFACSTAGKVMEIEAWT